MPHTPDNRIPLTLLASPDALTAWLAAGAPAAVLTDGELPAGFALPVERFAAAPRHRIGCARCAGRSAAAIALDRLFQARARGRCPWFDRVGALVTVRSAQTELRAALREDALTLARFREA